jgi:hypothetical protein
MTATDFFSATGGAMGTAGGTEGRLYPGATETHDEER